MRSDRQIDFALLHKSEMLSCPSAPSRSQNDPHDSYRPLNIILLIKNIFGVHHIVLGTGDAAVTKPESWPSWRPHSSGENPQSASRQRHHFKQS